jgi:uncharacterized membrane protein HdeD (DUF308 family)
MSRNYSPNHPTMRGRNIPPTIRQRTATVRQRLDIQEPRPNYKLRAASGFAACIAGLYVMEHSTVVSVALLTVSGWLWISGINGTAKEWEQQ